MKNFDLQRFGRVLRLDFAESRSSLLWFRSSGRYLFQQTIQLGKLTIYIQVRIQLVSIRSSISSRSRKAFRRIAWKDLIYCL